MFALSARRARALLCDVDIWSEPFYDSLKLHKKVNRDVLQFMGFNNHPSRSYKRLRSLCVQRCSVEGNNQRRAFAVSMDWREKCVFGAKQELAEQTFM